MTRPRTNPYLYVTWIPRYLTCDKSCLYAAWFKANHQGYVKMPGDFDSAKWNIEHADLMNKPLEELEDRGSEIFIERQNSFKVESSRTGAVIGGTPDIIAVHTSLMEMVSELRRLMARIEPLRFACTPLTRPKAVRNMVKRLQITYGKW